MRRMVMEATNKFTSFLLSYHPGVVKDLPVISPFAKSLLGENSERRHSKEELIRAFETDPYLSAKLLGVANSIFFNLNHCAVYTIRDALDRVGTDYATNLLHEAPYFSNECDYDKIQEFWTHCIVVAHTAKELSTHAVNTTLDVNTVFHVALIHDIGYLLEIYYDPTRLTFVANHLQCGEQNKESQSHVTLGESLANFWSVPDCARQAIRWHHTPGGCPSQDGRTLSAFIYLAETLVTCYLAARTVDVASCADALTVAGIDEKQLKIVEETLKNLSDTWTYSFLRVTK